MNNEISEVLAKKNYDYCNDTIALKSDIETRFLELGHRLWEIRQKELYKPNYETFDEFTLELKMSRATVSKLVNIYETFVKQFGVPQKLLVGAGGWSVVAEVLPLATTKPKAITWLEKAGTLTRADLRKDILVAKGGKDIDDCDHDEDYLILKICRKCKGRIPVEESQ
jgi:hypothetical protein